jgi:hypothetical protein
MKDYHIPGVIKEKPNVVIGVVTTEVKSSYREYKQVGESSLIIDSISTLKAGGWFLS